MPVGGARNDDPSSCQPQRHDAKKTRITTQTRMNLVQWGVPPLLSCFARSAELQGMPASGSVCPGVGAEAVFVS